MNIRKKFGKYNLANQCVCIDPTKYNVYMEDTFPDLLEYRREGTIDELSTKWTNDSDDEVFVIHPDDSVMESVAYGDSKSPSLLANMDCCLIRNLEEKSNDNSTLIQNSFTKDSSQLDDANNRNDGFTIGNIDELTRAIYDTNGKFMFELFI